MTDESSPATNDGGALQNRVRLRQAAADARAIAAELSTRGVASSAKYEAAADEWEREAAALPDVP
jgi:hypothetical protein